jgi:glutamine cyclotransferase
MTGPPGEPVGVRVVRGHNSGDPYVLQLTWYDGATHGKPIHAYSVFAKSNFSGRGWSLIMSEKFIIILYRSDTCSPPKQFLDLY